MLSDSNNVVVWLRPSSMVAKVGTGHDRRLAVELSVAQHLVACGAPGSWALRLAAAEGARGWRVRDDVLGVPASRWLGTRRARTASALFELHQALAGYRWPLPSYRVELSAVARVLRDAIQT